MPASELPQEPTEREAREFFEACDLSVERIPTGSQETPDFLVHGDGPGYLVEAKGRFDDASIEKELALRGSVSRTRPAGYSRAIERIVRGARKQMAAYDLLHQYYWLVWLSVETDFASPELTFEQFVSTLYGVRQVVYAGHAGKALSKRCYYARLGPFERWPEVDGAIISSLDGFVLCVNEFGTRKDLLCQLKVPMRLSERRAVVIPHEREARGECFVADTSIDRQVETVLRDYLRKRYNHPELQIVDFKQISVVADR